MRRNHGLEERGIMSLLFVDECGYTGQDLLSCEQPVLSIASLNCGERRSSELKAKFFEQVRAAELKHVSLAKRPAQQRMVLEFLQHLSSQPNMVKLAIAHKKYTLTTKMVDLLVAPAANQKGIDLFRDGANTLLSSTYFNLLPLLCGIEYFDDLLGRFHRMMLLRTRESFDSFSEIVSAKGHPRQANGMLSFLRMREPGLMSELLNSSDHCLDVAVAMTLALVAKWREGIPARQNITLIHDTSSAMARDRYLWDLLVDKNVPSREYAFGPDHSFRFPIGVGRTRNEESKEWAGLQLADVIAGAIARHARWCIQGEDKDDNYALALSTIIPSLMKPAHAIWPSPGIPVDEIDRILTLSFAWSRA